MGYIVERVAGVIIPEKQNFGKLVTIGDSITAHGVFTALAGSTGCETYHSSRGIFNWLQCMLGHPFEHKNLYIGIADSVGVSKGVIGHNCSIAGEQTRDNLLRFEKDVAPLKPDIISIFVGTNDVSNNQTEDTIFYGIKALVERSLAMGSRVLLFTIPPRNNATGLDFTSGQEAIRLSLNTKFKNYVASLPQKSVYLADLEPLLYDVSTGKLNTLYSTDGVHFNAYGAYMVALSVLYPWVQSMGIDTGKVIKRSINPEAYDATLRPYGQLLTNPTLTGTGGTKGTGATGTVPDSWTVKRFSGSTLTMVSSIVSRANWNGDTANFTQILMTSGGAGTNTEIASFAPTTATITTGITAGNWYEGSIEVILLANSSGTNVLRNVWLRVTDTTGDDSKCGNFDPHYVSAAGIEYLPDGAIRLLFRTPPIKADGTTGFNFEVLATMNCTIAGVRGFQVADPVLRRVNAPDLRPDPKYVYTLTTGASMSATGFMRNVIINKGTGSATAVSLVSDSFYAGQIITIKDGKGDALTNNITITPTLGTIDGAATNVIATNNASVRLMFDGLNWWTV